MKIVLLYRGSRDGWTIANFHSKCDNKGPTIMFVKTSLGRLCGAFTPLPWDSTGSWKKDESKQAFLFSLDSFTSYPLTDPIYTIFCRNDHGPLFGYGGHNLWIGYMAILNTANASYCQLGSNFSIPGDKDGASPLTGEKVNFTCAEVEIFSVGN